MLSTMLYQKDITPIRPAPTINKHSTHTMCKRVSWNCEYGFYRCIFRSCVISVDRYNLTVDQIKRVFDDNLGII